MTLPFLALISGTVLAIAFVVRPNPVITVLLVLAASLACVFLARRASIPHQDPLLRSTCPLCESELASIRQLGDEHGLRVDLVP